MLCFDYLVYCEANNKKTFIPDTGFEKSLEKLKKTYPKSFKSIDRLTEIEIALSLIDAIKFYKQKLNSCRDIPEPACVNDFRVDDNGNIHEIWNEQIEQPKEKSGRILFIQEACKIIAPTSIDQMIITGCLGMLKLTLENGDYLLNPSRLDQSRPVDESNPLHLAALQGNPDMVELLLETGANPKLKNRDGHTALDLAVNRQVYDLIQAKASITIESLRAQLKSL